MYTAHLSDQNGSPTVLVSLLGMAARSYVSCLDLCFAYVSPLIFHHFRENTVGLSLMEELYELSVSVHSCSYHKMPQIDNS